MKFEIKLILSNYFIYFMRTRVSKLPLNHKRHACLTLIQYTGVTKNIITYDILHPSSIMVIFIISKFINSKEAMQ